MPKMEKGLRRNEKKVKLRRLKINPRQEYRQKKTR
jgi:hypothetical protein